MGKQQTLLFHSGNLSTHKASDVEEGRKTQKYASMNRVRIAFNHRDHRRGTCYVPSPGVIMIINPTTHYHYSVRQILHFCLCFSDRKLRDREGKPSVQAHPGVGQLGCYKEMSEHERQVRHQNLSPTVPGDRSLW